MNNEIVLNNGIVVKKGETITIEKNNKKIRLIVMEITRELIKGTSVWYGNFSFTPNELVERLII